MDSELKRIEDELSRLSPGALPEGLIARMEAAMEGWEDGAPLASEVADKVVPFPTQDEQLGATGRARPNFWAAAAGVALLGAAVGIFLTAPPQDESAEQQSTSASYLSGAAVENIEFSPEDAKRTIVGATDRDLIIPNGAKPLRVLRLKYVDRYVFSSPGGQELHFDIPAVNYRVVPVPTD